MNKLIVICAAFLVLAAGCRKFLDQKPDKQLVTPSELRDLQSLLDYQNVMNSVQSGTIGEASADNYYLADGTWASLPSEGEKNMYIWGDEIIFSAYKNGWSANYDRVFYANLVLERLSEIPLEKTDVSQSEHIKGAAHFFRAQSFFMLAILWAKAYDSSTADNDLGIPLRLDTDFNKPSIRASVSRTYNQIISDLKMAIRYLPSVAEHVMRPSKAAAYALMARVSLSMRLYHQALAYADSSLTISGQLLNYNSLNSGAAFPVPEFNSEVLFQSWAALGILNSSRAKIDSALIGSYAENDLRKKVFFKPNIDGSFGFKGSYMSSTVQFIGLTTSEMYLTRAEALAREGRTTEALNDLNALLKNRCKAGSFSPLTAVNASQALSYILTERRKELVMRDIRWMDLKRLNKEAEHQVTVRRILNNQIYLLEPNDPRYALSIPAYVIDMSGIRQNPR